MLLASADLQGADGGRGLELLQDPHWQVEMLSFEGQSSYWEAAIGGAQQGRPPPTLPPQNHWMIYLEPRP